mgnify:CR=1 FL=1
MLAEKAIMESFWAKVPFGFDRLTAARAHLDPGLGPIWAWFTVTEIPTAATLWGGLIILSAVAVDAGVSAYKGASAKRALE